MVQETDDELTTSFSGEFPEEEWEQWKNLVPRSKLLEDRIEELVLLDLEVREQGGSIEDAVADFIENE